MNNNSLDEFQNIIKYSFKNIGLLTLALTHSSYGNEHRKEKYENNERIEFLGDAALDLIVSRYIYDMFPNMPEMNMVVVLFIIIALGAALLLGAAVIMLFYNMPAVRYGLLIILAIILIWKRKVLFSMLRMIQNKHE